jgi:RHS repeat-associated protein
MGTRVRYGYGPPSVDKALGALPVVAAFCRRLDIAGIVDRACPVRDLAIVTHGQVIEALVANRLTSPTPLVHVEDWARSWAVPEVFGVPAEALNDDRIGRALDAVAPELAGIIGSIGAGAVADFGIEVSRIHWDMTSISLFGAYEVTEEDFAEPRFGHPKDRRPDLRQIQAGLGVTADGGVPIFHRAYDGGAGEVNQVIGALEALRRIAGERRFLVVGDSKLISQSGDLAGLGLTSAGLQLPSAESLALSVLNPLGLTFVDRDGTRHVYRTNGINVDLPVLGVVNGQPSSLLSGGLAELLPRVLSLDVARYTNLCVDVTYTPPPGVHIGLSRYVAVAALPGSANPCALTARDPNGAAAVAVGFVAERPDRLRYEFDAGGRLLDMVDPNGVDMRYRYDDPQGRLTTVYEPRSCADPAAPTCRAFRFDYSRDRETRITDPAGRTTRYLFDANPPATRHLMEVVNPDGTRDLYTYQGVSYGGSTGVCDNASPGQLCTVKDHSGKQTFFTYKGGFLGPARLASIKDRRATVTTFKYPPDTQGHTRVDVANPGQWVLFSGIDSAGRVAKIDEGGGTTPAVRTTELTWDTPSATCRRPDARVDNNLCRQVRRSYELNFGADEDTGYLFNAEGRVLRVRQANPGGALDTTFGYRSSYVQVDGTVRAFDDVVAGSGVVNSSGPSTGRADASSLFALSDHTQSLTPRGNAAGGAYGAYLTTYKVDNAPAVRPNAIPSGPTCADPDHPTANTGNLCEVVAPSADRSGPSRTRYTYDTFGQRVSMATPKALAEGVPGTYTYTYYSDSDTAGDQNGSTSAGGWLKAVTDPTGASVVFGYDRAGNVVRTYDRNATSGVALSSFAPGAGPAGAPFAETSYSATLLRGDGTAYIGPWRYVTSASDPLGNRTVYTRDANGNVTKLRPPRGTAAGSGAYDIVQTFDNGGLMLTRLLPVENKANRTDNADFPTRYAYDAFGNLTSVTDPLGAVTKTTYDAVNRPQVRSFTRGPWPSDTSTVPPACRKSTSADAPIPAGRTLCSETTFYDGTDNTISVVDPDGQVGWAIYDAAHRPIITAGLRDDGTYLLLHTQTTYDPDGRPVDVCPPRQYTEGGTAIRSCPANPSFGEHRTYNAAGLLASRSTFRNAAYGTQTTTFAYDADGNLISTTDANNHTSVATYDVLDRLVATQTPRDATVSPVVMNPPSTRSYDKAGNLTAVVLPGDGTAATRRITAYSYDAANRLIDTVKGADNVVAGAAGLVDAAGTKNVRSRNVYDADGNVVASFEPRAFTSSTSVPDPRFMTRTDYDTDGRPVATWTPRYDGTVASNPASNLPFADPLGAGDTQKRDCPQGPGANGPVPAYPAGVGACATVVYYDQASRPVITALPTYPSNSNRYVATAYTDDHLPEVVNSPSPAANGARVTSSTTVYDGSGRPVKVTDALGHSRTTAYTRDGLVARTTDQPATQSNGIALTHVSSNTYDAAGNLTKVTDAAGQVAGTAYLNDNLPDSFYDGEGNRTVYGYDGVGNPTKVYSPAAVAKASINPSGTPTTNAFTADNLLLTSTVPVSGDGVTTRRQTTYSYDGGGRKTGQSTATVTGPGTQPGRQQTFTYSPADRLVSQSGTNPGGSAATVATTYDAAGHVTSVSEGGASVTGTYYLDGRPRSVTAGSRTAGYAYDGAGRPTGRTVVPAGGTARSTTYAYGDAGLVGVMASDVVGGARTTFAYDAAGRRTAEVDPNGVTITNAYNHDDTLASHFVMKGETPVARWGYFYDNNRRQTTGQVVSKAVDGSAVLGSFTYAYDRAGRLSSVTAFNVSRSVTWDQNSNRTSLGTATFTYNADDTLASGADPLSANQTVRPHTQDSSGRLSSDGCSTFAYDGLDRMTSATTGGATATGCRSGLVPTTTQYTYDGLGRQKATATPNSQGPATEMSSTFYDGWGSSVAVESNRSLPDTSYALDPEGVPKALTGGLYLADDGMGSVSSVTNGAGSPTCQAAFDPFGNPWYISTVHSPAPPSEQVCYSGSSPAGANSAFYRGARRDRTTGTYQFGARVYDPIKGSFLTSDTFGAAPAGTDLSIGVDPLTRNLYSYVNGDPLNRIDPSGHGCLVHNDNGGCLGSSAYHAAKDLVTAGAEVVYDNLVEPVADALHEEIVAPLAETAQDIGEFVDRNAETITKVATVVAAGAFVGVSCASTLLLGCGPAIVTAGAVTGAVFGALDCKGAIAGCALKGGLIGGVGAAATVLAPGAGLVAGAAGGFASTATSQLLSGRFDPGQLAVNTAVAGATAGVLNRLGASIGRLRSGQGAVRTEPSFGPGAAHIDDPAFWSQPRYHRLESPTQSPKVARLQETSGEIWGRAPRGSDIPKVQAYAGPLPPGARGIEFTTSVAPDPYGMPHLPTWSGPRPGVRVENDFAKIACTVTRNTQC